MEAVLLTGSTARGTAGPDSCLDVLVLMSKENTMPQSSTRYGLASCAVFVSAVALFVVSSTVFERVLAALPPATQRWIGLVTLVVPAAIGVALAVMGLRRPGGQRMAAAVGLGLNACFGLFFTLVLLFAG